MHCRLKEQVRSRGILVQHVSDLSRCHPTQTCISYILAHTLTQSAQTSIPGNNDADDDNNAGAIGLPPFSGRDDASSQKPAGGTGGMALFDMMSTSFFFLSSLFSLPTSCSASNRFRQGVGQIELW